MKKGKLFISLIWLSLAFIAIVGATFAWLSENRNVQAEGMQVQAETVKNLLISNNQSTGYAVSATSSIASNDAATMSPASSIDTLSSGVLKFYAPNSETKANYINYATGALETGAEFVEVAPTSTVPVSGTTYSVMKHTFWVKVDGQAADTLSNLYVSNIVVTRANTQSNISKALRVAVACPTNNKVYFYSVTGGQTTYLGISGTQDGTPAYTTSSVSASSTFESTLILANTVTTTTPIQIDVYVWYEGQDTNCTSENSLTIENLSVAITFSVTDPVN